MILRNWWTIHGRPIVLAMIIGMVILTQGLVSPSWLSRHDFFLYFHGPIWLTCFSLNMLYEELRKKYSIRIEVHPHP